MSAISESEHNPNPRIGRNAKPDEKFNLNIASWNVGNAQRDEDNNPLFERIDDIITGIIAADPPLDVLVLLEGNRPTQGISFTRLAASIEDETGMRYLGVFPLNATPNAFGKAVFVNPKTAFVSSIKRRWIDENDAIVAGPYFGSDAVLVVVHPVDQETKQVIRDQSIKAGFVHFPMGRADRLKAAQWVADNDNGVTIWMGDWNAFSDDGGPEMLDILTKKYHYLNDPKIMTFRAFPHDLNKKPAAFREQLNLESEVVSENEDGTIMVRFSSVLDYVFLSPHFVLVENVKVYPLFEASDHALIVTNVFL